MGQQDSWKMTPLDTMLCNNQLQILKSLVFFFPPARQRQMIFLVKLMELRQCLTLPLSRLSSISATGYGSEPGQEMFEQIFPYCDHEKQQIFRQMQNAFQIMKTVQQFSDAGMFDSFSEMMNSGGFGSMENGGDTNPFVNMGGLGGMMDALSHMGGNMKSEGNAPSSARPADLNNDSGNTSDGFASMFSSMMNPEQKALFAEYEAMLDDL
ncbi:MAG: hypothetical protein IJZ85_11125 [Lachnospiraceae bacterium]|nr:hypothetical protein [Lachnospiraceae bacterium]